MGSVPHYYFLGPEKLPSPTQISQKERVIPMSSPFPENVERSSRRTVTCKSIEDIPMTMNGIREFIYLFSFPVIKEMLSFTVAQMY
jgi:Cys-tRNA synthase (O-phospho-L-seryl-tRNA:Cys-tRNA synthase)